MPKKIFIGGLSVTTSEKTLYERFDDFGKIVSRSIDTDPKTGQSLGTGHVEYTTPHAGAEAISTMNNTTFDGAIITVAAERWPSGPEDRRR